MFGSAATAAAGASAATAVVGRSASLAAGGGGAATAAGGGGAAMAAGGGGAAMAAGGGGAATAAGGGTSGAVWARASTAERAVSAAARTIEEEGNFIFLVISKGGCTPRATRMNLGRRR